MIHPPTFLYFSAQKSEKLGGDLKIMFLAFKHSKSSQSTDSLLLLLGLVLYQPWIDG